MREQLDPRQLPLFPELSQHADVASITTLPAFEKALGNLINMSDLGAFIQLNVSGLEKLYSINLNEVNVPNEFLKKDESLVTNTIHLFPQETRSQLKKFTYEIKSFFNDKNSFKTSFGYFLFRSHFTLWKHFLESMKKSINDYVYKELSHGEYGKMFLTHFDEGYTYFKQIADITAPWEFHNRLTLKDISEARNIINQKHETVYSLKSTDIDYPFHYVVSKTLHVPMVLHEYVEQIQISAIFKTIHLEYLQDKTINSIEDIQELVRKM
ncbi:MAG: hypothetical protein HQ509_04835 [Candidatus Marinimicrobia bacterium]|nr:hypothetical protein [Candidatus Neomarinimicrobiota bacterium]